MRDLMVSSQIWGGVIGGLGLEEGNSAADFYASYYNDHVRGRHFHVDAKPRRQGQVAFPNGHLVRLQSPVDAAPPAAPGCAP